MPHEPGQDGFVLAICGSGIHAELAQLCVRMLRRHTVLPIAVVLDPGRTVFRADGAEIVHATVPGGLSDREGAIFLKTSLHRHLPAGRRWCYIDTDVMALRPGCEGVFDAFVPPVTFAPDHAGMGHFSRHAVDCGCSENWAAAQESLRLAEEAYTQGPEKALALAQQEIGRLTEERQATPTKRALASLRYHFSRKKYKLGEWQQDKRSGRWMDSEGRDILERYARTPFLEERTGLRWDNGYQGFLLDGKPLDDFHCDCLRKAIAKDFGQSIPEGWQHWNGGVFVFDASANGFLESWHHAAMQVLRSPGWRARDQGALIAAAWQAGLQHHATLPEQFNRIVDLAWNEVEPLQEGAMRINGGLERPALLHALGLGTERGKALRQAAPWA